MKMQYKNYSRILFRKHFLSYQYNTKLETKYPFYDELKHKYKTFPVINEQIKPFMVSDVTLDM